MRVLLIGGGGREHAMAWKLAQSPLVDIIYCAPGNGGTEKEDKCVNVKISSPEAYLSFAIEKNVDITVVGPEVPLVNGITDMFQESGLKIFGPDRKSAMLEGSKTYAKEFMKKYGVKTADYETFDNKEAAAQYLKICKYPLVLKADGLAAGKGVVICKSYDEALSTLKSFMDEDIFNGSGKKVVIEQYLEGVEASILAITDGETIIPFISARDHKTIYDNNQGPNTGGMGIIAPNPSCDENILNKFNKDILEPTLQGIRQEKLNFTGIIFFGLMICTDGVYLLEYNVRMGDPETEAVIPLMKSDFMELINCALEKKLETFKLQWEKGYACTIIAAAQGYPGHYNTGYSIKIKDNKEGKLFVCGAEYNGNNLVTSGGRVLALTSIGNSLEESIDKAYSCIKDIKFQGMYYRKDIGR